MPRVIQLIQRCMTCGWYDRGPDVETCPRCGSKDIQDEKESEFECDD